jgi:hypothetical protein
LSAASEALQRLEPPWIEAAQLYRKVCILRAEGRVPEAQLLEDGAFAEASSRLGTDADPSVGATLRSIMAAEESRVADAVVLSGILAPMLASRLSLPAAAPLAAPKRAPVPTAPGQRGIADFIDEMLAQERAGA